MGAAVESVGEATRFVRHSPLVIVLAVVGTGVSMLVLGLSAMALSPLLALPIAGIFTAGVVAAIDQTRASGRQSALGAYAPALQRTWQQVVVAYLIVVVLLMLVVAILFEGLPYVGASVILGAGALETGSPLDMGTWGLVGLGILLVVFAVLVALAVVAQFLDVAIAIGNADVVDSFRESLRLVRTGPGSVVGYTAIRVGFLVGGLLPPLVVVGLGRPLIGASVATLLGVAVGLVTVALSVTVQWVYHVEYYRRRATDLP